MPVTSDLSSTLNHSPPPAPNHPPVRMDGQIQEEGRASSPPSLPVVSFLAHSEEKPVTCRETFSLSLCF